MRRIPSQVDCQSLPARGSGRAGATLTEALVALMIMAIGVISLASLFPIAVLKTARANQLTAATDVRYNAESMMKLYPWIFSDPNPADTGPNGIPDGLPFNDYDFASGNAFLFDPQGLVVDTSRPTSGIPAIGLLPKFGGGFDGSMAAADAVTASPDTWKVQHEGQVLAMNAAQTQLDLSDLNPLKVPAIQVAYPAMPLPSPIQGFATQRVQVYYNGGKSSLARNVTQITGTTIIWSEDINNNSMLDAGEDQNQNGVLDLHPLPAGITYETAKLESRERRYTWLLTVRPQDVGASFTGGLGAKPSFDVTVVVFFGRGFSLESEQVYGTLPAGLPAVPNGIGGTALMPEGSQFFTVSWPANFDPQLKRGGYVLDAQNGYWYQIENYTDPTVGSSTIKLTTNILETSTLVAFPKAVVDVFPIAPQTP